MIDEHSDSSTLARNSVGLCRGFASAKFGG